MNRICPNPIPWNEIFQQLTKYAKDHNCSPPSPPTPLILNGWVYSNDMDKMRRWNETVNWASHNSCSEIINAVPDEDFYFVDVPTTLDIGPMGGPMKRLWQFDSKDRPSLDNIIHNFEILTSRWSEIIAPEFAGITRPLAFTGGKARRLLVLVTGSANPPWGTWSRLSSVDAQRRTFTHFRKAINDAITPHEVDHIEFIIEAEQS